MPQPNVPSYTFQMWCNDCQRHTTRAGVVLPAGFTFEGIASGEQDVNSWLRLSCAECGKAAPKLGARALKSQDWPLADLLAGWGSPTGRHPSDFVPPFHELPMKGMRHVLSQPVEGKITAVIHDEELHKQVSAGAKALADMADDMLADHYRGNLEELPIKLPVGEIIGDSMFSRIADRTITAEEHNPRPPLTVNQNRRREILHDELHQEICDLFAKYGAQGDVSPECVEIIHEALTAMLDRALDFVP